jgi:hypothetical protein
LAARHHSGLGWSIPADVDPKSVARVCAAIFQGLVLQQALEPDLDVRSYMDAVKVILRSIVRADQLA